MALGRVPGLKLDRTGIALMAVAALLATGAIDVAAIGQAVDAPTLVLLFALMLLSAQFAQAGFYDLCAARITGARVGPVALLGLVVAVAGGLSAVLANDIVVYAMTPMLCAGLKARGLDPRPFLIGLAGGSNAGSAATIIGNPQNILIGQVGGLDFWAFLGVCAVPAIVAMFVVFMVVRWLWRDALAGGGEMAPATLPAWNRWQTAKGAAATAALIALFLLPVPREVGGLGIAALLLASRTMGSRTMIGAVDWHLLLLFACLFAVTAAFAGTGIAAAGLAELKARALWPDTLAVMAPLALILSNTIGNVPAVILLMAVWPDAPQGALYGLALLSTLAGNLLIVGSLANIIVAERAAASGVRLGFADFARAGIPMTLIAMTLAVLWLGLGGVMPWR
ncbi:MAG: anion transporter [Alphaproteobacteria bacterium]|nr:anion transporter [Alphaproteobacteria bacterium]